MDAGLLTLTLALISAVESNCGKNVVHTTIRDPASVHLGQAAQGRFALMPATMRLMRTGDPELAALRYVATLTRPGRSACPLDTLRAWERGPGAKRGGQNAIRRAVRAKVEMQRRGATSPTWTALRRSCGDSALFVWSRLR